MFNLLLWGLIIENRVLQVGLHVGKEGFPTIAFNCVSDHNGRVIHVTSGHPGARNDKTIVRHDNFIMTLRTEEEFTQFKYKVLGPEGYEEEVTGAYVIADGGYHKWKETQCGVKYSGDHNMNSYSERLESVRKDIECVFGRLKRRFRILKLPFMCRTAQGIEDTFKLCCALHNMLLDHDGLSDIGWLDTDWIDVDISEHDFRVHSREMFAPRHFVPLEVDTDVSRLGSGHGQDVEGVPQEDLMAEESEEFFALRNLLVQNFAIRWEKHSVYWLKGTKELGVI